MPRSFSWSHRCFKLMKTSMVKALLRESIKASSDGFQHGWTMHGPHMDFGTSTILQSVRHVRQDSLSTYSRRLVTRMSWSLGQMVGKPLFDRAAWDDSGKPEIGYRNTTVLSIGTVSTNHPVKLKAEIRTGLFSTLFCLTVPTFTNSKTMETPRT